MKPSNGRWRLPAICSVIAACSGVPAQLGSRMTGPVPAGPERAIQAEACGFQLLLFFPISINDRMLRATQALEEEAAGDFITDVKIQESWTYGLVGTQYCTMLEAKAIAPQRPGRVQR